MSRLLLQCGWQPEQGSEASGVGALGCSGGGGQGLACMVARVPKTGAQGRERKHASEVPGKGRLLFPVVLQVSSVFPSHPPTPAS